MANELLRERRGHVEILTINRPEARNAIKPRHRARTERRRSMTARPMTTSGSWSSPALTTRAFSAGMDLKAYATGEFPITEKGFGGLTKRDFPKPLIAR